MNVSLVLAGEDLEAVRSLLATTFPFAASDVIPSTAQGWAMYDVAVFQLKDDDGELLGAALTNRTQVAVSSAMAGDVLGFKGVVDKVRELDLLAVNPSARGEGLGAQLLSHVETHHKLAGVEVLLGNVTPNLEHAKLRRFYERNGYELGRPGEAPPDFFGKSWSLTATPPPGFYFHKVLGAQHRTLTGPGSPAVRPPLKARRAKKPKRTKKNVISHCGACGGDQDRLKGSMNPPYSPVGARWSCLSTPRIRVSHEKFSHVGDLT